ncbi:Toluene efflux pump outer membrane protein TtgC [Paraburkholderia ultramafica]|uniref:Toluene efflux pump outer membrane protein TtgC n=1 Tax=Paraburkholderia ultramafica TaxID=1544867 RepID=A0A6S7BRE4_9BURK|nr:efflux transporter outer membrane subunit [Paraburkholderia ultramafica]CAB3792801.1 Toluene efflux pump outer membrane protein TtgC [Paraburkholderia ultramafica]
MASPENRIRAVSPLASLVACRSAWRAARHVPLASLVVAIASGCTGSLKLESPKTLPQQFNEASPGVSGTQASISDEQLVTWWMQFNDPALTQLIETAIAHNYDISIAASRVDQASAGVRLARSQLLPSVGLGVSAASYHGSETSLEFQELLGVNNLDNRFWRVGLQTQWEIDVFGRGRARLAAARATTLAAAGDAEAVRLSVIGTVADLYMTYRGLLQQRELLAQSHQIAADFVVIAEHSFTAGVVLSTDIDVARAGLAQVEARQQDVETAIAAARLSLENLCAVQPGELTATLDSVSGLPTPLPEITPGQPVDLLMRRPDLIAARDRLFASVKQSDAARLNYWPTFSLSGTLARNGWVIAGQSLGPSTFWLFGAAMALPLIDFGARESQVISSDAQAQQALLAYEKTASGALFDVEQALSRLKRQEELQKARNEEVTRRNEVLRKTTRQFKVGDIGRIDIDQARLALLESQAALVREQVGQLQAQVALFRAMGGGWQPAGSALSASPPYPMPAASQ